MRLSTRARYALRMMLDMAKNGAAEAPVSLASVSSRTHISQGYMEHLAMALRNGRLLRGVCGKQGGYQLARRPEEITVRQIIEAAIGPISILECVQEPKLCLRTEGCECRLVYTMINRRITEVLDEYTLGDLMDPVWAKDMREALAGTPSSPG